MRVNLVRLLVLSALILVGLLLCGCGGSEADQPEEVAAVPEAAEAAEALEAAEVPDVPEATEVAEAPETEEAEEVAEAPEAAETLIPVSDVRIAYIFYDGTEARAEGDEYVQIANQGDATQDLLGWTLRDKHDQGQAYTFGSSECPGSSKTALVPGEFIRVYTNVCHEETGNNSLCRGSAVWDDDGGTAQLLDAQGNVVDEFSYGDGGE